MDAVRSEQTRGSDESKIQGVDVQERYKTVFILLKCHFIKMISFLATMPRKVFPPYLPDKLQLCLDLGKGLSPHKGTNHVQGNLRLIRGDLLQNTIGRVSVRGKMVHNNLNTG
jgi:hypothetical protein